MIKGVGGAAGLPREVSVEMQKAEKDLSVLGKGILRTSDGMLAQLDASYKKASSRKEKKEIKAKKLEIKTLHNHIAKNISGKTDYVKLQQQVNQFLKLAPKKEVKELKGRLKVLEKQLEVTDRKISDLLTTMKSQMKMDVRSNGRITAIFEDIIGGEVEGLEFIERQRFEGTRKGYEEVRGEAEKFSQMGTMIIAQREQLARARSLETRVIKDCDGVEKQLHGIKGALENKKKTVERAIQQDTRMRELKKATFIRKTRNRSRLQKLCFWGKEAAEIGALKKEIKALGKKEKGKEAVLELLREEIGRVDERLRQDINQTGIHEGKIKQGRKDILQSLETDVKGVWEKKYANPEELAKGVGDIVDPLQSKLNELIEPTQKFIQEVSKRWKL